MKKILLGALVATAVAGVVYYLNDPEKFSETLDDLKKKADDTWGKLADNFSKTEKDIANTMS